MKSLLLPFLALTLFLPASQGVEAYYEKIFITNKSNRNIALIGEESFCVKDVFPINMNIGPHKSVMVNINISLDDTCGLKASQIYFKILCKDSKGRNIYPEFKYFKNGPFNHVKIVTNPENVLKVLNSKTIEFSLTK